MLQIKCPWCGYRDETEFTYGGEAHIKRPEKPSELDDAAWNDFLFMRTNPKGNHHELWYHLYGCRQWFHAKRDTVSYRITETTKLNTPKGVNDEAA